MSVIDAIDSALSQTEQRHQLRVLFAAESGSRAWGFASPDSDYDIRFIYLKPLSWYLSVGEPRDSFDAMLPGDLDLAGWELRKTLRLYAKGNMALNEWLGSPMIYREVGPLAQRMREGLAQWFQPIQALHHYLSMGRRCFDEQLQSDQVAIKRLFYALRPLLACRWINQHATQPPTALGDLVAGVEISAAESEQIEAILALKAQAVEGQPWTITKWWRRWLEDEIAQAHAAEQALPRIKRPPLSALDHWLQEALHDPDLSF